MATPIMGKSELTSYQIAKFVYMINPTPKIYCTLQQLAQYYLEEGEAEGVRGDIAFCQAIKETGYFRFGGRALPIWNNYAGLGVTGAEYNPAIDTTRVFADGVTVIETPPDANGKVISIGNVYSTPRIGVRSQIQHLKAYGTSEPLKLSCVDPRYGIVVKFKGAGCAPNWEDLDGKWAVPGVGYGEDIMAIYDKIKAIPIPIP
jgi:hypothetical protein